MAGLHQLPHASDAGQNHRRAALTTRPFCCQQGVIWFRLEEGPLHFVAGQYFKCAPAPTMLPLRSPRHAWPPTVKLSGAAAHAVNLSPRRLARMEGGEH
jgi:hypothetical protein